MSRSQSLICFLDKARYQSLAGSNRTAKPRSMSSREDGVPTEAAGTSPPLYLSYGVASLKGRTPALTDAVAAVPSFTVLSPPLGLDYFGVFDGHFGSAVAHHLRERLHGAVAEEIEHDMLAEAPRFIRVPNVERWWRMSIVGAFRAVGEEVLSGGVAGGIDVAVVGATALVALVLEKYIVLANCGVSRAVISRGGEAVQLTSEHRPNRPDEKQRLENSGGCVVESIYKADDGDVLLPTSRAFGSSLYKACLIPEPEVVMVKREARDEFLILATDGLWDYVTPAAACSFVEQKLRRWRIIMPWEAQIDGMGSPTILAKELAEHAVRAAGSRDNVSVVVVLFRKFWDERRPTTSN